MTTSITDWINVLDTTGIRYERGHNELTFHVITGLGQDHCAKLTCEFNDFQVFKRIYYTKMPYDSNRIKHDFSRQIDGIQLWQDLLNRSYIVCEHKHQTYRVPGRGGRKRTFWWLEMKVENSVRRNPYLLQVLYNHPNFGEVNGISLAVPFNW